MKKKKFISLLLILAISFTAIFSVYAQTSDVTASTDYMDALNHLAAFGIVSVDSNGLNRPNSFLTREEFAKIMVSAAGLEDTASALKGSSVFPDVAPERWSSGYINAAVNEGFIVGLTDGKFHPEDSISFAQACAIMVLSLGYTEQDAPGSWPNNYIMKASNLGLIEGINLKSDDGLPRWAIVIMIDRLLTTNIKSNSTETAAKTFAEASGRFIECIILGDSRTSDRLSYNQILTDKGIFYLQDSSLKLELGNAYRLQIDEDTVKAAYNSMKTVENISVDSIVNTRISYRIGDEVKYKTLPDKTVYYYQGIKQNYDSLKNTIQTRSSIVFTLNKDKSGYEYAVISDPVFSKPEVARNFQPTSNRLGSIDLSGNPTVVRDGTLSDILQIEEKDVVYQVSDIWNKYKYILAIDNRVGGKITAILPDKLSPKTLQIDGVNYDFSEDINFNKLNYTSGSFQVDDNAVALLGYDGRIVDLEYPGSENNSDYALILNTSSKISANTNGTLTFTHYAKLLTSDGLIITYDVGPDASTYIGNLVKFTKVDSQKAKIEAVPYNFPEQVTVNKLNRYINTNYVADNVKIFNIVSDDEGMDVQANLLDFKDLPEGAIADGKVYYINTSGAFNDINIMLTNDILNQEYKTAIVKSLNVSKNSKGIYSYTFTLLIEGKEYQYNDYINNADIGSAISVKMSSNGIDSIVSSKNADITSASVQAFDAKRIQISDKVFWFDNDIAVYFLDYAGNVTQESIADISINVMYGAISVYLNKPADQGGKVEAIIVKQ